MDPHWVVVFYFMGYTIMTWVFWGTRTFERCRSCVGPCVGGSKDSAYVAQVGQTWDLYKLLIDQSNDEQHINLTDDDSIDHPVSFKSLGYCSPTSPSCLSTTLFLDEPSDYSLRLIAHTQIFGRVSVLV